jgi:FHA domain
MCAAVSPSPPSLGSPMSRTGERHVYANNQQHTNTQTQEEDLGATQHADADSLGMTPLPQSHRRRQRPRPWGQLHAEDQGQSNIVLEGNYQLKDRNERVEDGFFIGRARACHLCLRDIKVSAKHTRIYRKRVDSRQRSQQTPTPNGTTPQNSETAFVDSPSDECTVFVQDLSTNGTYVNNVKLGKGKERVLNNGDTIAIAACADDGEVFFVCKYGVCICSSSPHSGPNMFFPLGVSPQRKTAKRGTHSTIWALPATTQTCWRAKWRSTSR